VTVINEEALAAAIAAVATWRSVRQARKAWELSLQPSHVGSMYSDPANGGMCEELASAAAMIERNSVTPRDSVGPAAVPFFQA